MSCRHSTKALVFFGVEETKEHRRPEDITAQLQQVDLLQSFLNLCVVSHIV